MLANKYGLNALVSSPISCLISMNWKGNGCYTLGHEKAHVKFGKWSIIWENSAKIFLASINKERGKKTRRYYIRKRGIQLKLSKIKPKPYNTKTFQEVMKELGVTVLFTSAN